MSSFKLKLIAVTAMLLDHLQVVFPQTFPPEFRIIGRLAFPLFAYLIAEGFRHTRDPKKFLLRLFAFALISEPFFDYALMQAPDIWSVDFLNRTNIFYTLFLGGAAITVYKYVYALDTSSTGGKPSQQYDVFLRRFRLLLSAAPPVIFFIFLGRFLNTDYGWVGVTFIFTLYAVKKTPHRLIAMAVMCLFIWYPIFLQAIMNPGFSLSPWHYLMVSATVLSVLPAACYNGKRGPRLKWSFYLFYPLHLAILGGVSHLLG
jgi:hypothetical protein